MFGALAASINDLIARLAERLKLSAIFPALCFVVVNQLFASHFFEKNGAVKWLNELDFAKQAAVTIGLSIVLGYVLNVLNTPIIHLFAGYPFRSSWWGRLLIRWQTRQKHRLEKRTQSLVEFLANKLDELPREVFDNAEFYKSYNLIALEYSRCQNELDEHFPDRDAHVMPTALGNTVVTLDEYPAKRYGLDSPVMWPRLLPILPREYAIFLERQKAGMDFMLNLSILTGLFALECTAIRLVGGIWIPSWIPVIALGITYLFYRGAIRYAVDWGQVRKAAFDFYRYQLAEHLGLKPFNTQDEERAQWEAISSFLRGDRRDFEDFDYPLPKKVETKDKEVTS